MAKRQNFVVGSTNQNTQTQTVTELNHAWDEFDVLYSKKLDGVFNAVSDYSNDSSNEIANAIQSITGAEPTGATQSELADALQQMRNEIETSSLTFKGYVSTTEPSSSTYTLIDGNLWINSATMPTSFPVAASSIKQWNGSAWVNASNAYTPANFDCWRNINDNEGYYWFGGVWTVLSTDMDATYFSLNAAGKWTINDTMKNISNWSSNVTNCIIETPQDIKLELSGGTLTLKAGSKVYVPNGAGVFDVLTITNDIVSGVSGVNGQHVVIVTYDGGAITTNVPVSSCFSGSTTFSGTGLYYNTTDNNIKYYNSGTPDDTRWGFPIAIVNIVNSTIISIDQVFNGFGYIGSTIFALPGVKGLIPNGRNDDGTLKNTSFTINEVHTATFSGTTGYTTLLLSASGWIGESTGYSYAEDINYNIWGGDKTDIQKGVLFGSCSLSSGKISNFTPKTTFHAVDYNDAVLTYGNQEIRGAKTFSTSIRCGAIQNSAGKASAHFSTAPTVSDVSLNVISPNNNYQANLSVFVNNNGQKYTSAPDSDRQGSIVTTTSISKSQNGYVKLGNGIIIQWGHVDDPDNQHVYTVTLPTAFTSTNYKTMVITDHNTQSHSFLPNYINSAERTTTTFTVYRQGDARTNSFEWIAIGY